MGRRASRDGIGGLSDGNGCNGLAFDLAKIQWPHDAEPVRKLHLHPKT